jgi:hypothetical protein
LRATTEIINEKKMGGGKKRKGRTCCSEKIISPEQASCRWHVVFGSISLFPAYRPSFFRLAKPACA